MLHRPSSALQSSAPPQAPAALQSRSQSPSTVLQVTLPSQLSSPQVMLQSMVSPPATPQATLPVQLSVSQAKRHCSALQVKPPAHEPLPRQSMSHEATSASTPQVMGCEQLSMPSHWMLQSSPLSSQSM